MKYMYTNGKYHLSSKDNASTMMQAFNYGTAAFEGMKAFYLSERQNWYIFRPDQHYARLKRSVALLGLDFQVTLDEFVGIIATLLKKNNIRSDVYIRPLVYRSEKGAGLTKPSGCGVSIFTQQMPHVSSDGFRCCLVSQRRPVDGTFSVKLAGNYLLSFLSHNEAVRKGYEIGILLSTNGYVSEASVMNLFFIKSGKLFTPSLACGPLNGITRMSIMELARNELGVRVFEGRYRPARMLDADEVFLCGTGSGISFVRQIEKRRFHLDSKELLAPKLRTLYHDATHGRLRQYADWLVPV